ncbi:hypothetical protein [Curtobacterium sp. ISL-83]|uniref:hypothetical protein n=1 Tax=Curtobacterium sp. ISL-83 TaxID=2819145 RepID=UPI001BE9192A|nr:hypothetical protein [Curtobacterium sp. ISL-83]MBT2501680.1 hypothetical protein [Curtobacterium sp. ISL-83]
MKRTIVTYGGSQYTVPSTDAAALQEQITAGLQAEPFMWLQVNHGEGRATPALLLISPATPVAIVTERDPDEQGDDDDPAARYLLEPDAFRSASTDDGHLEV